MTDDANGDLQLRKDIHLAGSGAALAVIQGNPAGWPHRMLRVQDGANVQISGVTIEGGHPVNALSQRLDGGGLDAVSGPVLLTDTAVLNNEAANGGGIYHAGTLDVEHH